MIPSLLRYLEEKHALQKGALSYLLLNSGVYRATEAFRNVALFYHRGAPLCVARWYPINDGRLELEKSILLELGKKLAPVAAFVDFAELNGKTVLFEELLDGTDLNSLVLRKLCTVEDAVSAALDLFEELVSKTSEPSSLAALEEELQSLFGFGLKHNVCPESSREQLTKIVLSFWKDQPRISRSIVHFNLTLKNIIRTSSAVKCFDCEFASWSHFAFVDWFRMWLHSSALKGTSLGEFELPEMVRRIVCELPVFRAFLVLYDLLSFRTQLRVSPCYLTASLEAAAKEQIALHLDQNEEAVLGKAEGESGDLVNAVASFEQKYYQARKMLEELTKKCDALQLVLSNQHARYATQHTVSELEQAYARAMAEAEHLKVRLLATENVLGVQGRHVAELHSLVQAKDQSLQSLIQSASFRLGHKITSSIRKFPGSERLIGWVRQ